MDFLIFKQLITAFALSALVGLEREHRYQHTGYSSFGGLRTFALIGLLGAVASVYFSGTAMFAVITAGFMALMVAAYVVASGSSSDSGATSEVSALLVYLLGSLCGMEEYVVATVVALSMLFISHFKVPLHTLAKRVNNRELVSTMQFVIITFVVLPLLPKLGYGPYNFFNPYEVWFMVVVVSGISFASYIAIKIWGARKGLSLTGFLAGFISTNAFAYSLAAQSKKHNKVVLPFALGVVIAITALYFRIVFEAMLINDQMVKILLIPMLSMGVSSALITFAIVMKKEKVPESVQKKVAQVKSPFSLAPAISFALIFAFVLFLSKFVVNVLGTGALHITSFLTGFLEMDSIVLSNLRLAASGDITNETAAIAITLAAIASTSAKPAIFYFFGNKLVAKKLMIGLIPVMLIGVISLLFI
jgi:uncharacterized membrane protein (DUF4010 family)